MISFGDAVNDLPLFEMSDERYAVEELNAAATGVIEGNREDAVARWPAEHAVLCRDEKRRNPSGRAKRGSDTMLRKAGTGEICTKSWRAGFSRRRTE